MGMTLVGCTCQRGAEAGEEARAVGPGADPALPGVSVDRSLESRLRTALEALGPDYKPRTHHLRDDGSPEFVNRLVLESSPYLLQHAHNPVNWFPWSDEAFERALDEDKPIFLSVGYSTCHWCHVMERESFEDEEIARYLNEHFIPIKVDREERPDVDSVYMTAVNILTGRGGWPMTVVMTADKQPFFGGTYFPPRTGVRGARKGLWEILHELVGHYAGNRSAVVEEAATLSRRIFYATQPAPPSAMPPPGVIAMAAQRLAGRFDPAWGGFGRAPKFPQPSRLLLLMRYARRTSDPGVRAMIDKTLLKMADGGMYDHLGGGFHRYSTDERWLVPHFEKMLYDNAQLANAYLEAWQLTGNERYKEVATETLDYVDREMIAPSGGFYSATDADSPTPDGHEEEGWFFTWTPDEIANTLDPSASERVRSFYGVTQRGNFEGRNILFRRNGQLTENIVRSRRLLYATRQKRPPPGLDDKILTAWNGLMISAFARGALVLGEPRYAERAITAARFIVTQLRGSDGRLLRSHRDGKSKGNAFLDDHAAMIQACLDLYELTSDIAWIQRALELQSDLEAHYSDPTAGGYFLTRSDHESLLVREKPSYDGAVPSGNSVAALNLVRLAEFTGETRWRKRAEALFQAFAVSVQRSPSGVPYLLLALDYYYDTPLEVVIVTEEDRGQALPLERVFRGAYVPNRFFAIVTAADAKSQASTLPVLEGKAPLGSVATAFVCERGRCELPTSNPKVFARQLGKVTPYPGDKPVRLEVPAAP